VAELPASILAVTVDCGDASQQAQFWSTVLSRTVVERNPDEFLVSDATGRTVPLYFMNVPEPKAGKNRWHLDLVTESPLADEVRRLTDLGAQLIEIRQEPDSMASPDTWAVLEDPEGNVFCVNNSATVSNWV
jgi:Glyoxalase-like domain